MPGVLTHLIVSFAGLLILGAFASWKFGVGFLIGQLIPDVIKFGIPAIRLKTSSFSEMMSDPIYYRLNALTHQVYFWVILCILIFGVTYWLMKAKKMGLKSFKIWNFVNLCFFISIMIHLVLDIFIIESSYWV